MTDLRLSLALGNYAHTASLCSGTIRSPGFDFTVLSLPTEDISLRAVSGTEFDVCEMSFADYCASVALYDLPPMIALPVFTSRVFRQSSIFIREGAGIEGPADLAGKRIGIPRWAQTGTVYVRGFLEHDAGVALSSVEWVEGGVHQPGRKKLSVLKLPPDVHVRSVTDRTLEDMLTHGDLDALLTALPPRSFVERDPSVRRLFPDVRLEEERYFRATGIFPILQVVVLRRPIYSENRWVARNLFDAFEAAKKDALARLEDVATSFLPTAWGPSHLLDANRMLFPGGDPWPYGLPANRVTIEAFLTYCAEQGVTVRKLTPEELFAPECSDEIDG